MGMYGYGGYVLTYVLIRIQIILPDWETNAQAVERGHASVANGVGDGSTIETSCVYII
jgi:hypothetical protein